jgi:hypothetical protein
MGQSEVRSFDYVNQPYVRVRDVLQGDALEVFRSATRAAASRARAVASELHVNVGGLNIGTSIDIAVKDVKETDSGPSGPVLRIQLEWQAMEKPHLFPFMDAELSIYPLTNTETQLDFAGQYQPPLGALGAAINAVVGRRVAEASVHRFVADVARHLRRRMDAV